MSILIKGMEMPKNCDECDFVQRGISDWCYIAEEDIPCNCPLIEVPPHGRLIDADVMIKRYEPDMNRQIYGGNFIHDLECAPTVIPSDKDGET